MRALLHLLKQKFTFKEMEGILYEKISQMYQQGKEKRKQAVQIIVRKKKDFVNDSFSKNLTVLCNCIVSNYLLLVTCFSHSVKCA